jgi:hypothetical protein
MGEKVDFFWEGLKRRGREWLQGIYNRALAFLRGSNFDPNERNLAISRTQHIRSVAEAAKR